MDLESLIENLMQIQRSVIGKVKVMVDIGGGERVSVHSADLLVKLKATEEYDDDEDIWNFEDGEPQHGIHFESNDELTVVIVTEQ